jgi:putative membrane protein
MDTPIKSANELAVERTDLAIERTVMAAGRTLMGWVRTALSLISFGFTIYKFLQNSIAGTALEQARPQGPRKLGLFLIALGTLAVLMGVCEYVSTVRRLNRLSPVKYRFLSPSMIIGILIGLLGLFLFITIISHSEVF